MDSCSISICCMSSIPTQAHSSRYIPVDPRSDSGQHTHVMSSYNVQGCSTELYLDGYALILHQSTGLGTD
eukprot:6481974-Amphidinium_carterae.1